MKLTFNSQEIEQALIEFVANQGISLADKQVEVHMVAGRGSNGFSAELDITAKQNVTDIKSAIPASLAPTSAQTIEPDDDDDDVEPMDKTPVIFGED